MPKIYCSYCDQTQQKPLGNTETPYTFYYGEPCCIPCFKKMENQTK